MSPALNPLRNPVASFPNQDKNCAHWQLPPEQALNCSCKVGQVRLPRARTLQLRRTEQVPHLHLHLPLMWERTLTAGTQAHNQ